MLCSVYSIAGSKSSIITGLTGDEIALYMAATVIIFVSVDSSRLYEVFLASPSQGMEGEGALGGLPWPEAQGRV